MIVSKTLMEPPGVKMSGDLGCQDRPVIDAYDEQAAGYEVVGIPNREVLIILEADFDKTHVDDVLRLRCEICFGSASFWVGD